ncbi:MAG TPA: ABC transporter permease [Pyrinomonadaceae bacterium]|nr:ABC transporter permease [Pyrinomonadaceae bacterium]
MQTRQYLQRNLLYFWRSNLAVVLGVAAAVAVLAGALLVGDSVRGSLSDLVQQRLGNADHVVSAPGFFRDQLSNEVAKDGALTKLGLSHSCPMIEMEGTIIQDTTRSRAGNVRVYGVDERFWKFNGRNEQAPPANREVLVSESLARELGAKASESLLVQVEKPSEVPVESLYGQKDDLSRTLRLTVRQVLTADQLGEFSVTPQQGGVRAVFVPLELLQREIEQQGRVNTILISTNDSAGGTDSERKIGLENLIKGRAEPEDYNLTVRSLDQGRGISLERTSTLIDDRLAETARGAAEAIGARTSPILSYVANSISLNDRAVPYSLVTAIDEAAFKELSKDSSSAPNSSPIILNEWAARDLGAKAGDSISLEYFVWHDDGRLETKTAQFQLATVVPISGLAADRDLVPEYPGISESNSMADWDPPFPVDLNRIRQQDEDYWDQYKTTPKAFIQLSKGQELWQSRFGRLTSMRIIPPASRPADDASNTFKQNLRSKLDPAQMGFAVIPVRKQGLEASRGATDFGEYFLYFSFFLVVSALLLTALFFKLGVEQRLREIGVLQAVGFPAARVRRFFVLEGLVLSVVGSLIGLAAALGYAQLMMTGLNTWWNDAVGTNLLKLHVGPLSLVLGAAGGIIAAVLCIAWTLRRLGRVTTRSLLMGSSSATSVDAHRGRRRFFSASRMAIVFTVVGVALLAAAALRLIGQTGGFFGGGVALLVAVLCYQSAWLSRNRRNAIHGSGWRPISQLGFRNTTYRPGRSVLCIALIASAAFIIVSVDAFRRGTAAESSDPKSGTGGYSLLAESLLPIAHDPNSTEGRETLNLSNNATLSGVTITRFRVRPGDDASCLNLYQPRNPRVVAPGDDFVKSSRFTFQNSVAETADEKANPWLLLNREFPDGAIPVIADANSLTYVLHLGLGEDFLFNHRNGPVKLRVVAALSDSIFQSELLMADKNFVRLFPEQEGYRFFLIETPSTVQSPAVLAALEDRMADFGLDAATTAERLANYHRVENTYLSTFQMLGGLGLLLGTVGLGAVLLRNVFERRRELALLRAVGYNSSHFTLMVVAENAMLLFCGLATGTVCALLAIAPVFFERGGRLPNISLGVLLLAVLISGLTASLIATWAALRSPLLPALKAE